MGDEGWWGLDGSGTGWDVCWDLQSWGLHWDGIWRLRSLLGMDRGGGTEFEVATLRLRWPH